MTHPVFSIEALNDATESENRMHSDDVAARYGFSGALVSGVNVFGYMTQPLVAEFGEAFLSHRGFEVRFLLPAYEGDRVSIETRQNNQQLATTAHNQEGVLLATLDTWQQETSSEQSALHTRRLADEHESHYNEGARPLISWEAIEIDCSAPTWHWQPTREENTLHVNAQRDTADCYADANPRALIHPYYLLDTCNKALMRLYVLPAWIHVGTRGTIHNALHVGDAVRVDCRPIDKWERKGHQFIRLTIAMFVGDTLAFEAEHTAIFRIAEKH